MSECSKESTRQTATEIVIREKTLPHEDSTKNMTFISMCTRDMLDIYKFMTGKYDTDCIVTLQLLEIIYITLHYVTKFLTWPK